MKTWHILVLIIAVVLIAVGLAATAWNSRPGLVEVLPANGDTGVPTSSQVQMEFSRAMEHESVTSRVTISPTVEGTFSWEGNSLSFTPNSSLPGGQTVKIYLAAGARAAGWLAFPMQAESWSFTTSAAYLAYLWPPDGPADIYALDPQSGEISRYTHGMDVLEFSASHDGMLIYFSANNTLDGADLYVLDRKQWTNSTIGTNKPVLLLECGVVQCRSPVVSADGKYLAYEHLTPDAGGELGPAIISVVGLPGLVPIPLGLAEDETVQPAWSPTGWLAYYDRTSLSYGVVEPGTHETGQLLNKTGQPGKWSPDGKFYLAPEIYYHQSAGSYETGTSHLLRYDVPDGTWTDLSQGNDVEDVEGTYSPGGESIAFARKYLQAGNWSFGRELWIMNADGSNPHAITNEPDYNHYGMAWSRDGKALAYLRFNGARPWEPPELWMINADGSNPVQLVIGGYSPLWIP